MSKNIKIFKTGLIPTKFVFTYGVKAYSKYLKSELDTEDEINSAGCTSVYLDNTTGVHSIVIAVVKSRRFENDLAFKSIIMHEISHATTYAMERMRIKDDEFRSYLLQWLYKEIMPFIEKLTTKGIK